MFSFGVDVAQPATKALAPLLYKSVVDEETQKRNTDCICFLASPLTCKKGASCEFRHSEIVRLNPRDCRFWKSGNCLNPCCSFRHLPLEEKPAPTTLVPSSSAAPIVPQFVGATVPSRKSKTPCYFFSQGCCTKNDKCPFMHGVAPRADATRNPAVVVTDRPRENSQSQPHGLKETASVDQMPVFQGAPQAVLQSHICLERPNALERKATVTAITHRGENPEQALHDHRLHFIKRGEMKVERSLGLFDNANKSAGGSVQSARRSQSDAPCANCPMSSSNHDHTALNSGTHPDAKSPSDSTRSENDIASSQGLPEDDVAPNCSLRSGQFDTFSKNAVDIRASNFRMKENCKRHRKSLVEQRSTKNLQSQAKKQWEGNNLRTHSGKVEIGGQVDLFFAGGDKWPCSEKRLKSVKDNYASVQIATSNEILNLDKAMTHNTRQRGSSAGTSNKETKHFTGPKSLAQIKAEKTAQGKSSVETVERCNFINTIIDAGRTAAAARKKSRPAENAQIAGKSPMSTVAYNELVEDKQRTAFLVEFEGPKPLSLLLKRKRELQSGSSGLGTCSAPEAEADIADSSLDLEDGKVGGDFKDLNEGTTSSRNSVLVHGDLQPISPRLKHRAEVEATILNVDFPEGLDSDTEIEDVASMDAVADGSFDFGMDDEDEDDDEEDFAKKLGRIFALSSD